MSRRIEVECCGRTWWCRQPSRYGGLLIFPCPDCGNPAKNTGVAIETGEKPY